MQAPSWTCRGKTKKCDPNFRPYRVGPYLFLTIPGEPFVEYGFQIEKAIADRAIPIVVGYANGNVQYVCAAKAHKEGGYEPNMTPLAPDAEPVILKQVEALADRVIGDVFESFAPTLPVNNKDYTPSIPIEKNERKRDLRRPDEYRGRFGLVRKWSNQRMPNRSNISPAFIPDRIAPRDAVLLLGLFHARARTAPQWRGITTTPSRSATTMSPGVKITPSISTETSMSMTRWRSLLS